MQQNGIANMIYDNPFARESASIMIIKKENAMQVIQETKQFAINNNIKSEILIQSKGTGKLRNGIHSFLKKNVIYFLKRR